VKGLYGMAKIDSLFLLRIQIKRKGITQNDKNRFTVSMSRIQIRRKGITQNDKDRFTVSMTRIQIRQKGITQNDKDRYTVSMSRMQIQRKGITQNDKDRNTVSMSIIQIQQIFLYGNFHAVHFFIPVIFYTSNFLYGCFYSRFLNISVDTLTTQDRKNPEQK
jgi:hypothetical protein